MYKIKKFSILNEIEFSKSESIEKAIKTSDTIVSNFIKCIEFGDKCKTTIPHWIDVIVGKLKVTKSNGFPYGMSFIRISDTTYNFLPSDIKQKVSDSYGQKFIESMKIRVLNDKNKGTEKYSSLVRTLSDFNYDNEYYVRMLSILSNILDGEIDISSIDISEVWDNKYSNIIVYNKGKLYKSIDESKIWEIIHKFIKILLSDEDI